MLSVPNTTKAGLGAFVVVLPDCFADCRSLRLGESWRKSDGMMIPNCLIGSILWRSINIL